MATNVAMKLEKDGHTLVVRIDLNARAGISRSGKSEKVASTGGNIPVPDHPELRIGVNVYQVR